MRKARYGNVNYVCLWIVFAVIAGVVPVAAQDHTPAQSSALTSGVAATGEQSVGPAAPQGDFVQPLGSGTVHWQKGVITARGIGLPPANAVSLAQARSMAIRAAVVDARRNLLAVTKGVQIDATTTVQSAMVANDTVVERVRGFLQTSQILDTAYMSDGSVEVVVGMRLHGGLSDALLPPAATFGALRPSSPLPPASGDEAPAVTEPVGDQAAEDTADQQTPLTEVQEASPYTGLLVDARGLGVRPAMSPRILTESGREIYGTAAVSREFAIQQGLAGYARNLDKASANERIAGNPMVVKAVAATGAARTDIIISDAQAERLGRVTEGNDFLKQCRVMIVLD